MRPRTRVRCSLFVAGLPSQETEDPECEAHGLASCAVLSNPEVSTLRRGGLSAGVSQARVRQESGTSQRRVTESRSCEA